jgi:class 3 adenylate cyclase/TolB-like protein
MERRLAAILAADVVGYARLMERDEADTFERLRAHRKDLFEPEIGRHKGRIFKLMGDGLLAEFASVVDAVECAVVLQRGMAERNSAAADEKRIDVRIGINLGDVIVEGDDRHGDGVNIAARLQQLAEPGGIAVSRMVVDNVKNKLALRFEAQGEHHVKNIAEPVPVYRLAVGASSERPRRRRFGGAWHAGATAVFAVAAAAGAFWYFARDTGVACATRECELGVPTILVLPFQNLTGDPALDVVGQGIAEDLRDLLWNFPEFQVVSGTSSALPTDGPPDLKELARKFDADFVIEGTVRRNSDRAVVTAQLINSATDTHDWSERIEEAIADPVELEKAVSERLAESLGGITGILRTAYERIVWSKAEADLSEYDWYVRGHWRYNNQWSKENVARAREIFSAGLARFPDSALLRIKIAFMHYTDVLSFWSEDPAADIARAKHLIAEASEVLAARRSTRFEDLYSHWVLAWMYEVEQDGERCVEEAEAAAGLSPYDGYLLENVSWRTADCGKPEAGIEWAKKAIRLNPGGPPWGAESNLQALAWASYLAGRYEEAVKVISGLKARMPLTLAASYVHLGRLDDARAIVADFVRDNPGWTVRSERDLPFNPVGSLRQRWLDDLRAAGLPEE